jgi:hypothetical protein
MVELHFPWVHPVANRFPSIDGDAFKALVDDIRKNGQRRPIALFQGQVWDGRARLDACRQLGIQPKYLLIRRRDPIIYLIQRHDRYGAPRSPERTEALKVLQEIDTPDFRTAAKKARAEWIAEARRDFRNFVAKKYEPCAACGKHIEFVHAHHSLPLNIQFDMGIESANHDHDWLCPVHHRIVHAFVSIYIIGSRNGEILDNIPPHLDEDWASSERVFRRGMNLFEQYGGQEVSWVRYHDRAE